MGKRNYRGKRQPIPKEYRHRTHVHRAQGNGLGCPMRMITALVVSVVVIVGMVTAG